MHKKIYQLLYVVIFAALFLLTSCKKKFDDYYERPDNLADPIYKQLADNGKFSNFVSLINKAGYKDILNSAGYWTIFAPSDSAFAADTDFAAFLQSKGAANAGALDSASAQSIVQYLLVYNAFEKTRLDDYQSSTGWVENNAFKRRTAYYTGFYNDTTYAGVAIKAIASNRNNVGTGTSNYFVFADNNSKYIPFFTTEYFSAKGLSASDYNYFYPNSVFSGFNVSNARVTQKDITAENGVIHIIDKVVLPLKSIDQYLRNKPDYSVFRSLLERFLVLFIKNNDATHRYQVLSGKSDDVLVKVYSNLLAFSPNNENFFKLQDNDAQRDGWTMFVPKNDSLQKYISTVVLENYPSIDVLPINVIADLINAHLWQTIVWPSRFNTTYNYLGEVADMNPTTNIIDKKVLSNGVFYGTNKVNAPNVFSTVYGKAYLNPKYSLMTRLLDMDLRSTVSNPNVKYTMIMMSDAVIAAKGYSYNAAANSWTYVNPVTSASSTNDSNRLNLLRMLNTCVIETPNNELANIGAVNVKGIIKSYGGECVKYDGANIYTAGSLDNNLSIKIDSVRQAKNGQVVYVNNLLYFSYSPISQHLEILGTPAASEFNLFWNFLKNSTIYTAATRDIVGVAGGSFYTVFVPNNAAIKQACADGILPGTAAVPLVNPTTTADKLKVANFLAYHILDKRTVIADGLDIGAYPSTLKNPVTGDPITFVVQYPGGVFSVTDGFSHTAKMVTALSNQLSNRAVIHLMDKYLQPL